MKYFMDPNVAVSGTGESYATAFKTLNDAIVGITPYFNTLICKGHSNNVNSETIDDFQTVIQTKICKIESVSGDVRPGFSANPKEMFTFTITGTVGVGNAYFDIQNGITLKNLSFTFWELIGAGADYDCCIEATGPNPLIIDYCQIDWREPSVPGIRTTNANSSLYITNSAVQQGGLFAGTGEMITSAGGLTIDNCFIWLPHGKILAFCVGAGGTIKNSTIIIGYDSVGVPGQTAVDWNWLSALSPIQCINNLYIGFDWHGGAPVFSILHATTEDFPIGPIYKDPTPRGTIDPTLSDGIGTILSTVELLGGGYRPTLT